MFQKLKKGRFSKVWAEVCLYTPMDGGAMAPPLLQGVKLSKASICQFASIFQPGAIIDS